jgi:hypothetical protein
MQAALTPYRCGAAGQCRGPVYRNLDEILAWREERTVTRNLTLHYDRMMLLLDPTRCCRPSSGCGQCRRPSMFVVDSNFKFRDE